MTIGIVGQYELAINIDGVNDVVREENFDFFAAIEDLGGGLPTFELQFRSTSPDLIARFNEGCQLSVRYADGRGISRTAELFIVKPRMKRRGVGEYLHNLVGTVNQPGYNTNQRIQITDRITSVEAIRAAVSPYFTLDTNCNVNDAMNWIQHNISDRRFIWDTMMHMDIPNSFPLMGITMDGRFRLLDARKVAAGKRLPEFGYGDSGYLIDVDFEVRNNGTLLNSQAGYGIEQSESVLGKHKSFSDVRITQPVSNLLTHNTAFNRAVDSPTRRLPPVTLTDDMHANYWEAYRRNYASALAYSSSVVEFGVRNRLIDASIGDLALFRDDEAGNRSSIESYSGQYFISKLTTKIEQRNMISGVSLTRENVNRAEGALR